MLFFLIEQREDNIYDFFTIQKDCKVVWFTGCFAWGYEIVTLLFPAKIFSGLLFLSCVMELLLGLIYRNKNKS